MSNIAQKTHDAYLAGATFSMDDSFNLFGAICIGAVILLVAYIILCVLKGLGDDSIRMVDAPSIIIRAVLIVLVLSSFFYFQ
ncbi:hypothetical protein A9G48_04050 [Gilliamella sp. wkB18]|uniref:DUF3262 family protein n=1 Tax=Gilliamella sp. wkB18 TaxID=3120260 RepID=UPI00080EB647|nr:DUF3262 family protein [Gilliamella apicola]OCG64105.1 hypothetical protein A9G48_04050 [Gilliamella apicola]